MDILEDEKQSIHEEHEEYLSLKNLAAQKGKPENIKLSYENISWRFENKISRIVIKINDRIFYEQGILISEQLIASSFEIIYATFIRKSGRFLFSIKWMPRATQQSIQMINEI